MHTSSPPPLQVTYTNYRGETSRRLIIPLGVRFGATEYHPEPQWLLEVYDVGKHANRTYTFKDITEIAAT